jgi:hypothetical protein
MTEGKKRERKREGAQLKKKTEGKKKGRNEKRRNEQKNGKTKGGKVNRKKQGGEEKRERKGKGNGGKINNQFAARGNRFHFCLTKKCRFGPEYIQTDISRCNDNPQRPPDLLAIKKLPT